jgi:hypothetical protein
MIDRLLDNYLIKPKHKNGLYIFCVLLRILIGFFILTKFTNPDLKKYKLIVLNIMILVIGSVWLRKPPNWKCYPRNIISNILSLILVAMNKNDLAAGLIFVDVLNGIQLKHIANLFIY